MSEKFKDFDVIADEFVRDMRKKFKTFKNKKNGGLPAKPDVIELISKFRNSLVDSLIVGMQASVLENGPSIAVIRDMERVRALMLEAINAAILGTSETFFSQ